MKLDMPKLGAGMLAAGPLLIQFGNSKLTWWAGVIFAAIAPILMAWKTSKGH